jgi:MFS family permease
MSGRFFAALCVMGFFAILSSTMSKSPVLAPFAESLGTPAYLMGFVASASTIPGILASLPFGSLSDRVGRGKVIIGAAVIFATAPFLYLFVMDSYQLILVRFYHGFATAILVPVANAAIVERYPDSKGQRVSTFSSSTAIGRAIAPAFGGYVLLVTISNYHDLYLFVGMAGILALVAATGLRERRDSREVPVEEQEMPPTTAKNWSEVAFNRGILVTSLVEAAQYYTYGAFEFYVVLYAQSLGIDILMTGVILAAEVLTFVVGKPLMGGLSDRVGRRRPILLGLLVGGISMVTTQLATTYYELILVSVVYGLGFALVTSSTPPLVSELTRKEVYGSAMGFLGTIMDIGQALGPIVTGFILAAGFGYSGSFTSLGLLLFLSGVVFWANRQNRGVSHSESLLDDSEWG